MAKNEVTNIDDEGSDKNESLNLKEQKLRVRELELKIKALQETQDFAGRNLTVEELSLKIDDLKKSDFKRISTYTSIAAVLIAVGGVIGQNIWSGIKSERAMLATEKAQRQKDSSVRMVNAAKFYILRASDSLKSARSQYTNLQVNIVATSKKLDSLNRLFATAHNGTFSKSQVKELHHLIKSSKLDLSAQNEFKASDSTARLNHSSNPITSAPALPERAENHSPANEAHSVQYPDDPQKGKWGMKSEDNSRKLLATVKSIPLSRYYEVILTVVSTDLKKPLAGKVTFHLHNSFFNPNPVVEVEDNQATLNCAHTERLQLGRKLMAGGHA